MTALRNSMQTQILILAIPVILRAKNVKDQTLLNVLCVQVTFIWKTLSAFRNVLKANIKIKATKHAKNVTKIAPRAQLVT
jgi:hypothetical protein